MGRTNYGWFSIVTNNKSRGRGIIPDQTFVVTDVQVHTGREDRGKGLSVSNKGGESHGFSVGQDSPGIILQVSHIEDEKGGEISEMSVEGGEVYLFGRCNGDHLWVSEVSENFTEIRQNPLAYANKPRKLVVIEASGTTHNDAMLSEKPAWDYGCDSNYTFRLRFNVNENQGTDKRKVELLFSTQDDVELSYSFWQNGTDDTRNNQ